MITVKTSKGMCAELYGLSTDTKPSDVANASTFFEMDSGILYMFDAASNEWYMIVGGLPADPAFSSVTVEDLNEDGVSMRGGFEGDNDDEPVLTLEGTDDGHSPVRIAGVAQPQEDDEAANKAYVDAFGQRITTLEAKRKMAYVNDWVPDSYQESAPYDISWFFPAVESGDFVVDKRGHLGVVVSVDSDNDLVTVRGAGVGPVTINELCASLDMVAETYDTTDTYYAGDFVIEEGNLYICTAQSTTGAWNVSDWQEVTIMDEISKREPKKLIVNMSFSNNDWYADKTYAEIEAAFDAGKTVVVQESNKYYNLWKYDGTVFLFNAAYDGNMLDDHADLNIFQIQPSIGSGPGLWAYTERYLSLQPVVETIVGTTATIAAADNTIYQCGELTSLTVSSSPMTGQYSIVFTSGATATTTTFPSTILGLEDFAAEANTMYEINVLDNRAVVGSWAVSSS